MNYQSGVESLNIVTSGLIEERLEKSPAVIKVLVPSAQWIFKFSNGHTVVLRGPLVACVRIIPGYSAPLEEPTGFTLRFEHLQFDAEFHDKSFALDRLLASRLPESPSVAASENENDERRYEERILLGRVQIPSEPVNGFGIPQATMRCLEVRSL